MTVHRLKYELVQRYKAEVLHNQPMRGSRNGWWAFVNAYRDAVETAWPTATIYWKINAVRSFRRKRRRGAWSDGTVQAFLAEVLGA